VRRYLDSNLHKRRRFPLRSIRDGHFIGEQGFVTFLNPGPDGRMQHLVSRRRLYNRSG
jgi:hypothetical protein